MTRLLAILLALSPALAEAQGLVLAVGDAPVPDGLPQASAAQMAGWLGLSVPRPGPSDVGAAVARLGPAAKLYFEEGDRKAARKALGAALEAIPLAVPAAVRATVVKHLLLLAQLEMHRAGGVDDRVTRWLDRVLRVDPTARPTIDAYRPTLVKAFEARAARYRKTARAITAHLDGAGPRCRVLVDGVDRGAIFNLRAAFLPGEHDVVLRCGDRRSWTHRITLGDRDTRVTVAPWELELRVEAGHLRLSSADRARRVVRRLLTDARPAWVLRLQAADAGRVTAVLHRPGRARLAATTLAPEAIPGWLQTRLKAGDEPTGAVATRSARWWHWTLLGGGIALIAGGAAANGVYAAALDETTEANPGRVGELDGLRAAGITLYATGAAAAVTGMVLAIVGAPDEPPPTSVFLAPGRVGVSGRF